MSSPVAYKGHCHCGANRFELTAPEITSATTCNCSLCSRHHVLWLVPDNDALRVTKGGPTTLTTYQSSAAEEQFCSSCGICVSGTHSVGPLSGKKAINVRNVLGINVYNIHLETAHMKPEDDPYSLPAFEGALPDFEHQDAKLYKGACHCGAVRIAVKSPPLPGVEVKEDNCSICARTGSVQIYPHSSQVSITGKENTEDYKFGRKFNGTPFCKTCGGHVFCNLYGPPEAVVQRLSAAKQEMVKKQLEIQPVNLRALDGIEWSDLTIQTSDEGQEGYSVED